MPPDPAPPVPPARPRSRCRRWLIALGIGGAAFTGGASFAMPRIAASRLNANESTALATLKNISSAQSQTQASGVIDVDGNGSGEYGFFAEMAGVVPTRTKDLRAGGPRITPPVLHERFGAVRGGRVRTGGYVFQMFLRGAGDTWVAEAADGGGIGRPVEAAKAETEWVCYAWPIEHGVSGRRAFMINQNGDIVASNMGAEVYSGDAGPPPGVAAYVQDGAHWVTAANTADPLGNLWVVV